LTFSKVFETVTGYRVRGQEGGRYEMSMVSEGGKGDQSPFREVETSIYMWGPIVPFKAANPLDCPQFCSREDY
jgi:hypothetical protein